MKNKYQRVSGLVVIALAFASGLLLSKQFPPAQQIQSAESTPVRRKISSLGFENKCLAFYNGTLRQERLLSAKGLEFHLNKTKKRVMAYEYVPPVLPGGPVAVFLHGLGDSLYSMQALAERAKKDGFGILRMDLHGHGETLLAYLKTHKNELPDVFDYRHNVDDVKELIQHLNLKNIAIVGHSYGGGIALKLAEEMPKDQVKYVLALAPYVQRIDKYLSDSVMSGQYVLDSAVSFLDTFSLAKEYTRPMFQQMFSFAHDFSNQVKTFLNFSNLFLGTDHFKDMLLDPKLDKFMYDNYKKYFLHQLGRSEYELSEQESKLLELRVYAAIKVTKGIRGLDYLNNLTVIGQMPALVQVVGGRQDKLVLIDQLDKFSERLKKYNVPHEMLVLEGGQSTHLFPQNLPDQVYDIFLEGVTRPE